ncbi:MAG TPA: hypothetical protein VFQ63_03455 [Patescibacteria group bacterium]|nr:hypothetical protein [Patescibacteria group bacterium]
MADFRERANDALQRAREAGAQLVDAGRQVGEDLLGKGRRAVETAQQRMAQAEAGFDRAVAKSATTPAGWILQSYDALLDPQRKFTVDPTNRAALSALSHAMGGQEGITNAEFNLLRSLMSAEILRQVHTRAVDEMVIPAAKLLIDALIPQQTGESTAVVPYGQARQGGIIRREHAHTAADIAGSVLQAKVQQAAAMFEQHAPTMITEDPSLTPQERARLTKEIPAMRDLARDFVGIVQPGLAQMRSLTDVAQFIPLVAGHRQQVADAIGRFRTNRFAIQAN